MSAPGRRRKTLVQHGGAGAGAIRRHLRLRSLARSSSPPGNQSRKSAVRAGAFVGQIAHLPGASPWAPSSRHVQRLSPGGRCSLCARRPAGRPSRSARCSSKIRRTSNTAAGCAWTVDVVGGNHDLAGGVVHVRALARYHAVAVGGQLRQPPLLRHHPDDIVILHPRRPTAGQHHRENRRVGRQRVDAGVDPQQRAVGKCPRVVAEQFLPAVGRAAWASRR